MTSELPRELLADLTNADRYPHPAGDLVHLETHISHVFLAGEFAYKLKKPVDFGFLDFTTPEKRRAACNEELRLNRRLAPDIYLAVVPVCRGAGGHRIALDGCGAGETVAEAAVRMRRMSQDGMLDRLAVAGRLELAHMVDIARQLAAFHARAERGPQIEQYGHLACVRVPVEQNFEQTAPYTGTVVSAERCDRLHHAAAEFLDRHGDWFEARVRSGRIVDGHGDLHLRNMCLHHGRVVIFDCIEFNPALRAGDVMSDIAFLTMDLDHRRLPVHGNRFLNEYLEQTRDYAGLLLLDFYQAYRACVRGKVLCFETGRRPQAAAEAAEYFALAERYLASRRGGLLITCGVSGSGKTTLARQVAAPLGAVMVRSDAVRKHLAGIPLSQRGAESGRDIYGAAMTERTYAALLEHAREVVASGRWAILDAVYGRASERAAAVALARELGVPFGILYCTAPHDELRRRVARRAQDGKDISDATVAVMQAQLGRFEAPRPVEAEMFEWTGKEDPGAWIVQLRSG